MNQCCVSRLCLDSPLLVDRSRSACCVSYTAPVMNQCVISFSMSTSSIINDDAAIDFDAPTPSHTTFSSGSWTPMVICDTSNHQDDDACQGTTSLVRSCSDHHIMVFEPSFPEVDLKCEAVEKIEQLEWELERIQAEVIYRLHQLHDQFNIIY